MAFLQEYTMLDEIGRGGFATVYKVRHNELGYIRAVRVLNETIVNTNSQTYQKFLRECKVLLRLGNGSHPHIVHIYFPRLLDNKAVVEMDYVDGVDLTHYLKQNQNFVPVEEVIRMAEQMSSALAYCHEDIYRFCMDRDADHLQDDPNDGSKVLVDEATRKRLIDKYKVIHNDIHSGNIMRRNDGSFVLLDFGLAINGNEVVRSSRHANGAPEFKAPEKWDDDSILTEQSDIYSFGIVLYHYLAGRVPFPYNTKISAHKAEYELGEAHQKMEPPAIEELRRSFYEKQSNGIRYERDYPQWLEDIILKCLAKSPAERFDNGRELHEAVLAGMKQTHEHTIQKLQSECNKLRAEVVKKENERLSLYNELKTTKKRLSELEAANMALTRSIQHSDVPLEIPELPVVSEPPRNNSTIAVKGIAFTMIYVQGGAFLMGSDDGEPDEKPMHDVEVSDFYMGESPVVQALWQAVMGNNPSSNQGDTLPVERVSWDECQEFCKKLNALCRSQLPEGYDFALPMEAEWEYAARGGNMSNKYKFSGSNHIDDVAWFRDNSGRETHPVKQKNANELGLYDMSGNVWEWCEDRYTSYLISMSPNHRGPYSDSDRVLRGGGWGVSASGCRVAKRNFLSPGARNGSSGFRLALVKR